MTVANGCSIDSAFLVGTPLAERTKRLDPGIESADRSEIAAIAGRLIFVPKWVHLCIALVNGATKRLQQTFSIGEQRLKLGHG